MERIAVLAALVIAGAVPLPAAACTFCGGGLTSQQTLREHFHRAKYVAHGQLKNARFDPNGGAGTTELHVIRVLKPDPAAGPGKVITLPRYLPVIGDTPPDYLVFCVVVDGKLDPLHGAPASAAVTEYLLAAAKLDEKDPVRRLGYYFQHLDAADPAVAADAFLEFAKAPDAEIVRAKGVLEAARVRKLLTDPATPAERLGVLALLLGLCGGKTDARLLAESIAQNPLPDRVRENLGGFLAALTLLDAEAGWTATETVLTDPRRPFDQRLTAIGTVRFFQASRPDESKPRILRCYRGLLAQGDLADMAADDLRRWQWWDLTPEVLKYFDQPTHAAPAVRRGIVRYALQCPAAEAKAFITRLRQTDPQLVGKVEQTLKLYEPVKK